MHEYNPIDDSQKEQLVGWIQQHKLEDFSGGIIDIAQNCVRFAGHSPDSYEKVGNCRLGGLPDATVSFEWPEEMAFLAQLNMTEIAPFDHNKLLPDSGMLYFFIGDDESSSDLPMRVIWQDHDIDDLVRIEAPPGYKNTKTEYYEGGDPQVVYSPRQLSLVKSVSLPYIPSRFEKRIFGDTKLSEDQFSRFDKLVLGMHLQVESGKVGRHQLLGYQNLAPYEPDVEACAREFGVDPDLSWIDLDTVNTLIAELDKKDESNWSPWYLEHLKETRRKNREDLIALGDRRNDFLRAIDDWILLFEIDSDLNSDICFWDAGQVHVVIRKQDLLARNFDNIYAHLFSS